MKPGYLYVLVHPSDPNLYKIGVTVLQPEKRLAQHNRQLEKAAGRVVKETGQKWELKTFIEVPDPYWAEGAFWGATWIADIPFRGGVEVVKLDWETVRKGLESARIAGVRPPPGQPEPLLSHEWMLAQLAGTGITLSESYRGVFRDTNFRCDRGHSFKASAGAVAYWKSCPSCKAWNWFTLLK